jgi:geranylgeranyl pyrophosphate synthase
LSNFAKHDGESLSRVEQLLADARGFVEDWLGRVLPPRDVAPRRLHCAMHDAVFRGARRTRPMLCKLVADAHGNRNRELVGRYAAALELVHCAAPMPMPTPMPTPTPMSMMVQHDLPDFARVHGEAMAVLVGDALLTLAFDTLANAPPAEALVACRLMRRLAAATSHALKLESHEAQRCVLFRAAAAGGAIIGGADDVSCWERVGELVGAALSGRARRDAVAAPLRAILGGDTREGDAILELVDGQVMAAERMRVAHQGPRP